MFLNLIQTRLFWFKDNNLALEPINHLIVECLIEHSLKCLCIEGHFVFKHQKARRIDMLQEIW